MSRSYVQITPRPLTSTNAIKAIDQSIPSSSIRSTTRDRIRKGVTLETTGVSVNLNHINVATLTKTDSVIRSHVNDVIVLFDLETTGLPRDSDICQIAAWAMGEPRVWSQYLIPQKKIHFGASKVNKLKVKKIKGRKVLTKCGKPVCAEQYERGLKHFYHYLTELRKKYCQTNPNSRIILIAHNGQSFDAPILLNAFAKINVTQEKLKSLNVCFADSLLIIKDIQKENPSLFLSKEETDGSAKRKKVSTSLPSLYERFFHEDYSAHDAVEDVKAMKRVLFDSPLGITKANICNNTFTAYQV